LLLKLNYIITERGHRNNDDTQNDNRLTGIPRSQCHKKRVLLPATRLLGEVYELRQLAIVGSKFWIELIVEQHLSFG